jgi:2-methylisocitrate lyase-like PEP mutase family enzyme
MPSAATDFRSLHSPGHILVLTNAWDAASARMAEELGAKAVATSSASLAWSHGYADGEMLTTDILLGAVAEVLRAVSVPVTVDSEGGYSSEPAVVADYAARLIDLGVAGINLEDGHSPADLTARKVEAIKTRAARMGGDLFVNARTDVYLKQLAAPGHALAETLARARRYADAGADGIFVPGVKDEETIGEIVKRVALPLNILALPGTPDIASLKSLGVRRVSTGAGPGRAAYGSAFKAMQRILADGQYDVMFEAAASSPNFNKLFAKEA